MSEFQEKGVSNNKIFRAISNTLDNTMQWSGERKTNSYTRSMLHGGYHNAWGELKQM